MAVEERVKVAVDNWAPRFLANGIDPNDFARVTKQVERWEDWSREWSACGDMHARLGEQAEAEKCYESAGYHYFHAAMAYHFGKFVFVQNPGELRAAHEKVVDTYQRGLPYFEFPGERVAIPYEGGATMYGILRKPWHVAKPPVVILMPGLDSVKEELHNYGDDMLRRGMAVLAIDGPGQGELEWEFALRPDYEVSIRYAIDYLETRPDVDATRVGLMGVSLGGYFAPRAAAFEKRVKAAISLAGAYNLARNFDRYPLLTREAFVYRTKSANEGETKEKLAAFNLQEAMPQVSCPLLVIMGKLDRIFPASEAEQMAAEAGGPVDFWLFEDGNHVCNNIPYKYRPQQADWMRRQL
ncbi:MAG TPA: alpha/beta fold hydrolase [Ktedonobacteraceae bacterium]|jgi:2,6-dihydroxypseudooxynicotine hydrolase|nr:alpha/beta fold hydrolase [Ktedonobacteraceae bacterium]